MGGLPMKAWFNVLFSITFVTALVFFINGCVAYEAARDERSIGRFVDDKNIAMQVKYRLLKDEKVKGLDISVYSYLGKVYLVGAIEDPSQGQRAEGIAREVEGVKTVTSYFLDKKNRTTGMKVDDSTISTKVRSKLIQDEDIKSTQIDVKTLMGHVILLGVVASERDKATAINHAKSVNYVRKVKSFIIVWRGE